MNTQTAGYRAKALEPRNLAYFFLIVLGVQALGVGLFFSGLLKPTSGWGLSAVPGAILLVLSAWMPCIAAFVVTAITEGISGTKALWRRLWNHDVSLRWLLVALLTLPTLHLVVNLVYRTLDRQAYPFFDLPNRPWMVIAAFISNFLLNGIGEEFGWRGYVLPRLQARWGALTSSIVLGVIWAAWHFGNYIVPGSSPTLNIWEFTLRIVILSILFTWAFNNTKGSVLAVALLHAVSNTSIIWMGFVLAYTWPYLGVMLATATLIVIFFGPKNLVSRRPEEVAGLEGVRAMGAQQAIGAIGSPGLDQ